MNRRFPVWAPRASRVALVISDRRTGREEIELSRGDGGWWALDAALDATTPIDYGFLVDGEGPYPDPRSLRQPRGVHELSREYDPSVFEWTDHAWTGRDVTGAVVYELHIGTFTPEGTLDSAIERLDYLVDLGVDAVEPLPVNAFNGEHGWGYDGVLWFAVHEAYGGPAAYQRFVDACHSRGLAVVQDVVYNHLGPSGNYLPKYGPYLSELAAGPWGDALNLDGPGSDEVRRLIIDNALFWLHDMHVDGLRLDAVHALHDSRALHILEELAESVDTLSHALGRPLTLIAESDLNDPKLFRSRESHGYGLAGQWDDDVHHAVHVNVTGETTGYYEDFEGVASLVKVFEHGWFHDGSWSSFRERHHGRPLDPGTALRRLVAFTQDHDQIGNRATGDRMSALVGNGSLAAAAAIILLGPFTPMLFMGEEWGATTPWQFFTSHPEKELGEATARGRIAEFARMGWDPDVVPDPQDPTTFERSHLDWAEPERPGNARILAFYKELIALRRSIDPDAKVTDVAGDAPGQVFTFSRGGLRVIAAFGEGERTVTVTGEIVLAFGSATVADSSLRLVGPGVAILR
ncbi:malto-oligosyltrehalose trehalohydrolase [Leifsonia poae]|uniref:malto-oligosyltrehalose trehalohydrolase n=1 Tax=Leifsonia poae TaxID=110933 RepID=UPI003D679550